MIDPESITHDTALEVFRAAYARRVGVGDGRISHGDLQDAIGVQVRTSKSWRDGQAMPHLDSLLRLFAFFGPAFADEVLGVAGLGGVEPVVAASEVNAIRTAADLSRTVSELTERLVDGRFCHVDCAAMGPKLVELAPMIEQAGKAMMERRPG